MISAITRQLQIDLITDTPNPLSTWFNRVWNELSMVMVSMDDNTKEFIYFKTIGKQKRVIFYHDSTNNILCDYHNYWKTLEQEYRINYHTIQSITKMLIEHSIGGYEVIPNSVFNSPLFIKDDSLNCILRIPFHITSTDGFLINVLNTIKVEDYMEIMHEIKIASNKLLHLPT
jgi:hypothetical protein